MWPFGKRERVILEEAKVYERKIDRLYRELYAIEFSDKPEDIARVPELRKKIGLD